MCCLIYAQSHMYKNVKFFEKKNEIKQYKIRDTV